MSATNAMTEWKSRNELAPASEPYFEVIINGCPRGTYDFSKRFRNEYFRRNPSVSKLCIDDECNDPFVSQFCYNIARDDPVAVQLLKDLGSNASGCAGSWPRIQRIPLRYKEYYKVIVDREMGSAMEDVSIDYDAYRVSRLLAITRDDTITSDERIEKIKTILQEKYLYIDHKRMPRKVGPLADVIPLE